MPSFSTNIYPTSTGLTVGNANQKWIAYCSNIFVDTLLSNSANTALTGFLRLASTDLIAWRNAANTADISLSKTNAASSTTPADVLVFSGAGIEGPLISNNLNPASVGEIRLASSDVVNFRKNANTGDINALTHNSDDTLNIGGPAGVIATNMTVTGTLNAVNVQRLDGVVNAAQFTGSDMGAK